VSLNDFAASVARVVISPKNALRLPLHDAFIFELKVTYGEDGFLQASLEVEISTEY